MASTGPRSGTAASRSPDWCCCCRTCCSLPAAAPASAARWPRSARSGWWHSPSGRSCRAGSRSCLDPLRGAIRALRDVPVVRHVRGVFGGYERWRALHRTAGLFVAAGFLHGLLDGTPFDDAPVLRWSYVAIGAIGLGFYVYRELLARFFVSLHDYEVDGVHEVDDDLTEVVLRPIGRRSTSCRGSSPWSTSRPRTGGTGTRSRSPARRKIGCCASRSRRSATTRRGCRT